MSPLAWFVALAGFGLASGGVATAVAKRERPWLGSTLGIFVGAVALIALFASVALGALDGLLARMHVVGAADRPLTAITGIGTGASASFVADTIERWAGWYRLANAAYVASPTVILRAYLIVDSLVFVPAYVTLLAMIRWRSATLEPGWKNEPAPDQARPWEDIGQLLRRVGIPLAVAAADLVENALTDVVVRQTLQQRIDAPASDPPLTVGGGIAFALRTATTLKWVLTFLLILNTIPALVAGLQAARRRFAAEREQGRGGLRAALFRIRGMVVLVVGFCLIATLKLQVPDVIRRWSWREATFAGLSALAFGVVVWLWSGRIITAGREGGRRPSRRQLLIATTIVGLGGVAGLRCGPIGLFVPAGALLVLFFIDPLGPDVDQATEGPPTIGAVALPKLLAVAPIVFLGVGALRALLPEAIFNHPHKAWPSLLVLLFAGVLPIAVAMAVYMILGLGPIRRLSMGQGLLAKSIRVASIVLAVFVYWRVITAVWSFSQAVGALAITGTFFTILAAGVGAVSLWIERVPPSRGLAGLGFRRTPVFAFLLAWLVLAGAVAREGYHDVRTDLEAAAGTTSASLTDVLDDWMGRNQPPPDAQGKVQIPMLFVAANGGGIKAATWTAFALDCVLDGGDAVLDETTHEECRQISGDSTSRVGSVVAMSGVSGGSVGLVEYLAHETQVMQEEQEGEASGSDEHLGDAGWVRSVLTDDFVSPSIAWQLFVEAPRAYLQFLPGMDRAEVLERAWERAWVEPRGGAAAALWGSDQEVASSLSQGFMSVWDSYQHSLPLLLLNGTTVEDGCRTIVSALATDGTDPQTSEGAEEGVGGRNCTSIARLDGDLPPGQLFAATRDARHFLCDGNDVRLSTAALMSARFPWVSPSGGLPFCQGEPGRVHLVDGGYLDNSGGETVAELWEAVRAWVESKNAGSTTSCIVPYLIIVDSGYGPTPAPKSEAIHELLVPPKGFFAARSSRTIEGRNDAALAFRQPVEGVAVADRVATLYLRSQPEGEAPLGWTIDDTTAAGLEAQLLSNKEGLDEIQGWFTNAAPCSP